MMASWALIYINNYYDLKVSKRLTSITVKKNQ